MSISRLPGALLLTLAFLALTAEGAARTDPAISGLIVPAADVLAVLWPEQLVALEIWVTRTFGAWAWDPAATGVLAMPGWMTLGGLGVGLLWLAGRRPPGADDVIRGDDSHQLFEDLARAAEAEGLHDTDADMGPRTTMAHDITPETPEPGRGPDTDQPGAPGSKTPHPPSQNA